MDIKLLLGQRIQEIRLSKNITQEKLAELVEVETASISNIERGKYYPSARTLNKIIEVLKVEPQELFTFKHLAPQQELIEEINKAMQKDEELTRLIYKFFKVIKS